MYTADIMKAITQKDCIVLNAQSKAFANNITRYNGDTCDCWETNRHRFYFRKRVISRALYEMLMDISAIRQIIQEEQEERKNL